MSDPALASAAPAHLLCVVAARANLLREGIAPERIHFTGNVMIDSLRRQLPRAVPPAATLRAHGQACPPAYGLLSLHRPSNVDAPAQLEALLGALGQLSQQLPLLFPIHPRTLAGLRLAGLEPLLARHAIVRLPPLWDGHAATRIAAVIAPWLAARRGTP